MPGSGLGGNRLGNTSTRMLIENNRFGQTYYPSGAQKSVVAEPGTRGAAPRRPGGAGACRVNGVAR
jgi:hypothetical protein